jgi:CheY-like chemotaxis protein
MKIAGDCGLYVSRIRRSSYFWGGTNELSEASMGRILVVDDDPDSVDALCCYLRKIGHTVEYACNGQDALVHIIHNPPDLVILDVIMPQMDGCSLLEILRSYLRLQALPVIVLTRIGDSPIVDRARQHRVSAILTKGSTGLDEIAAAINGALQLSA